MSHTRSLSLSLSFTLICRRPHADFTLCRIPPPFDGVQTHRMQKLTKMRKKILRDKILRQLFNGWFFFTTFLQHNVLFSH
jgi:hypothetical protein